MTDWEVIEKKSLGGGKAAAYGPKWETIPAVAINKSGLTLNKNFADAYIKNGATQVLILIAKAERKLGLKIVPAGEYDPTAFTIGRISSGGSYTSKAKSIHAKFVAQKFPDAIGRAYRAHSDARGNVIEIELTPENVLR